LCRTVSRISWRTCVAHLLSDHTEGTEGTEVVQPGRDNDANR